MQWLTKKEAEICLQILGEESICGTELVLGEIVWEEENMQELFRKNILEPTEEGYRMEEKIFLCFQTACKPEAYLRMENQNGETMLLYVNGETIVYTEMKTDGRIGFLWLPILPLAIGAYTDFLKKTAKINQDERTENSLKYKSRRIEVTGRNKAINHAGELHMVLEGCGNMWQWEKEDERQIMTGERVVNRITEWFALVYSIGLRGKEKWRNFQ